MKNFLLVIVLMGECLTVSVADDIKNVVPPPPPPNLPPPPPPNLLPVKKFTPNNNTGSLGLFDQIKGKIALRPTRKGKSSENRGTDAYFKDKEFRSETFDWAKHYSYLQQLEKDANINAFEELRGKYPEAQILPVFLQEDYWRGVLYKDKSVMIKDFDFSQQAVELAKTKVVFLVNSNKFLDFDFSNYEECMLFLRFIQLLHTDVLNSISKILLESGVKNKLNNFINLCQKFDEKEVVLNAKALADIFKKMSSGVAMLDFYCQHEKELDKNFNKVAKFFSEENTKNELLKYFDEQQKERFSSLFEELKSCFNIIYQLLLNKGDLNELKSKFCKCKNKFFKIYSKNNNIINKSITFRVPNDESDFKNRLEKSEKQIKNLNDYLNKANDLFKNLNEEYECLNSDPEDPWLKYIAGKLIFAQNHNFEDSVKEAQEHDRKNSILRQKIKMAKLLVDVSDQYANFLSDKRRKEEERKINFLLGISNKILHNDIEEQWAKYLRNYNCVKASSFETSGIVYYINQYKNIISKKLKKVNESCKKNSKEKMKDEILKDILKAEHEEFSKEPSQEIKEKATKCLNLNVDWSKVSVDVVESENCYTIIVNKIEEKSRSEIDVRISVSSVKAQNTSFSQSGNLDKSNVEVPSSQQENFKVNLPVVKQGSQGSENDILLQQDNNKKSSKISELENQIVQLKKEKEVLEQNNNGLSIQKEEMQKQIDQLNNKINRFLEYDDRVNIENIFDGLPSSFEIEQEKAKVAAENAQLRATNQKLKNQEEILKQQLNVLESENSDLKSKTKKLEAGRLNVDIERVEKTKRFIGDSLSSNYLLALNNKNAEIEELKKENIALKEQLQSQGIKYIGRGSSTVFKEDEESKEDKKQLEITIKHQTEIIMRNKSELKKNADRIHELEITVNKQRKELDKIKNKDESEEDKSLLEIIDEKQKMIELLQNELEDKEISLNKKQAELDVREKQLKQRENGKPSSNRRNSRLLQQRLNSVKNKNKANFLNNMVNTQAAAA